MGTRDLEKAAFVRAGQAACRSGSSSLFLLLFRPACVEETRNLCDILPRAFRLPASGVPATRSHHTATPLGLVLAPDALALFRVVTS